VSVAVNALSTAGIPFISVLNDPTYGGVSASYAMQADVRIALSDARIGFAGPQVILNTMCGANQEIFDKTCPADFQSANYVLEAGQIDLVIDAASTPSATQRNVENTVASLVSLLVAKATLVEDSTLPAASVELNPAEFNYTRSREIDRPQAQDIISNLFDNFVELSGDGKVGRDCCIRGGLAKFSNRPVVVLGTFKGHSHQAMQVILLFYYFIVRHISSKGCKLWHG